MKPLNNRTIVKVEKRLNDKVMVAGQEFILDSVFRHYWNTVQMAEVISTQRDDVQPGDIVYVHHFVNAPEQILPMHDNLSYLESNQIYARIRDGKMKVLSNFILVEPVTYGQAGLVTERAGLMLSRHSTKDYVQKIGVAKYVSEYAIGEGINVGDIILFNKNCEYEILIGDQILYRMEARDVITTIDSFEDLKI